jgi:hypothetical protein
LQYYERGNALKKRRVPLPAGAARAQCAAAGGRVHARSSSPRAQGSVASGRIPIFIVGLPRAGSTLLEQILASHSRVEGTMELADIPRLVQRAAGREQPRLDAALSGVLAS